MLFHWNCFLWPSAYKQLKDLLQTKDMFQNITISDYLFYQMFAVLLK